MSFSPLSTENSKDVSAAAEEQKQPVAGEPQETSSRTNKEQRPVESELRSDAQPHLPKPAATGSQGKENVAQGQTAPRQTPEQTGSNAPLSTRPNPNAPRQPRSNPPPRQQGSPSNPGGYRSSVTVERKKKMAAAISQRKALQLPEDMENLEVDAKSEETAENHLETSQERLEAGDWRPEGRQDAPLANKNAENAENSAQDAGEANETQSPPENLRPPASGQQSSSKKKTMSTSETAQSENPGKQHNSLDEEKRKMERDFEEMIATFVIPDNIDPVLLDVWMRREKENFFKKRRGIDESALPLSGRKGSFAMVFASYLSVLVMITLILFGMINGTPPAILLKKVFLMMVCFFILGYLIGIVVDNCISESAREMIRELIKRSQEAQEAKTAETATMEAASP